jgi:hypothetical protein
LKRDAEIEPQARQRLDVEFGLWPKANQTEQIEPKIPGEALYPDELGFLFRV